MAESDYDTPNLVAYIERLLGGHMPLTHEDGQAMLREIKALRGIILGLQPTWEDEDGTYCTFCREPIKVDSSADIHHCDNQNCPRKLLDRPAIASERKDRHG
jgi:hypothetical protein